MAKQVFLSQGTNGHTLGSVPRGKRRALKEITEHLGSSKRHQKSQGSGQKVVTRVKVLKVEML